MVNNTLAPTLLSGLKELLLVLREEGVLSYKYEGLEIVLGPKVEKNDNSSALSKEDNLANRMARERQELSDLYAALPSYTPLRNNDEE